MREQLTCRPIVVKHVNVFELLAKLELQENGQNLPQELAQPRHEQESESERKAVTKGHGTVGLAKS
jgi:hypothetical protein